MKSFALTNRGIEDLAAQEIKELIKAESEVEEQIILFETDNYEQLVELSYRAQSLSRVLVLLNTFAVGGQIDETLNNISAALEKSDLYSWLNKDNSFKVFCKKTIDQELSSTDISAKIGEQIINLTSKNKEYTQRVDIKNPDVLVYIFFNQNKGYIGIDFCGFDLSKRDYKIFSYSQSIKSNVGYALLKLAGYDRKKILLDPFCGDGAIPIEAALFSSEKSINFYRKEDFQFLKYPLEIDYENIFEKINKSEKKIKEKIYCFHNNLGLVNSSKKNSKIAGVNKILTFGKVDTEWLDSRLEEGEIDCIVSSGPRTSKHVKTKVTTRLYDELFYQAKYILKKQGKVVLLTNDSEIMKNSAKKHDFNLTEERAVWLGKQELVVCVFSKD